MRPIDALHKAAKLSKKVSKLEDIVVHCDDMLNLYETTDQQEIERLPVMWNKAEKKIHRYLRKFRKLAENLE